MWTLEIMWATGRRGKSVGWRGVRRVTGVMRWWTRVKHVSWRRRPSTIISRMVTDWGWYVGWSKVSIMVVWLWRWSARHRMHITVSPFIVFVRGFVGWEPEEAIIYLVGLADICYGTHVFGSAGRGSVQK